MDTKGKKISDLRKEKGYTQEELAELSKINLRTIQRIENNKSEPRGKTLSLICDALDVDVSDFQKSEQLPGNKNIFEIIINLFFYFLFNLLLMTVPMFLILDSEANLNSRVGGFLLSFFIPFFIVYYTPLLKPIERVFKFGTGYVSYIIMLLSFRGLITGFQIGFRTGLFLALIISIAVLFYGHSLLKNEK